MWRFEVDDRFRIDSQGCSERSPETCKRRKYTAHCSRYSFTASFIYLLQRQVFHFNGLDWSLLVKHPVIEDVHNFWLYRFTSELGSSRGFVKRYNQKLCISLTTSVSFKASTVYCSSISHRYFQFFLQDDDESFKLKVANVPKWNWNTSTTKYCILWKRMWISFKFISIVWKLSPLTCIGITTCHHDLFPLLNTFSKLKSFILPSQCS